MESGDVTLVDELSGETVITTADGTVAELIERRRTEVDLPRCNFRGQPLDFQLVDQRGDQLSADRKVEAGTTVRLTSADAADIIDRRNRWLADMETGGTGTSSVASGTQLALVERTESRLDDVARLRAAMTAERPPPPRTRSRFRLGGVLLTALVLLIVGGIFATWAWWFIDDLDSASAGGRRNGGDPTVDTIAAVELGEEEFLVLEDQAVPIGPGGVPPPFGCEEILIDDFEPPGEMELELSCETAIVAFQVDEAGVLIEVSASSGRGDPIVWIYDEDGNEVAFNDDTAGGLNSFVSAELDAGPHEVHVGNLTGEFSLLAVTIELG